MASSDSSNTATGSAGATAATPPRTGAGTSGKAQPRQLILVAPESGWTRLVLSDFALLEPQWTWRRVDKPEQALSALGGGGQDAILVDGLLPETGPLLEAVEKKFPGVLRVVRCDVEDRPGLSRWTRGGATVVGHSEAAGGLAESLRRGWQLERWLAEPALKKVLSQIHKLPAIPRLHAQVTDELRREDGSMEVVGRLIGQDPVMTAKMLQVVNSAVYGLASAVTDAAQAAMLLGMERTRGLILLAAVFSQFEIVRCPGFSLDKAWGHSLQVGSFSRRITLAETKDPRLGDMAFTAGLLHDVGKLVLAANLPEMFNGIRRLREGRSRSGRQAELEIMGTTHSELGACLLGTWGLPLPILEAVAWHHCPESSTDTAFTLLTAVHIADVLTKEMGVSNGDDDRLDTIRFSYLLRIGLADRRNGWRELCGVPIIPDEDTQEERLRRRAEAEED